MLTAPATPQTHAMLVPKKARRRTAIYPDIGGRFWGQVRGSARWLRELRGNHAPSGRNGVTASKTRREAAFPDPPAHKENLHGKGGGRRFESVRGLCKKASKMAFSSRRDPLNLRLSLSPRPLPSVAGGCRIWREQGPTAARSTSITRRADQPVQVARGPRSVSR
jgi:hypothetical protein